MSTRAENLDEIYALSAMTQRLMRAHMLAHTEKLHIGPSEGQLLHIIAESQPVSLKKLAESMHMTPGAITQLVESLVQSGFVTRTPSDQDRRVMVAALTPEGSRTIQAVKRSKEEMFTKILDGLSDEELSVFVKVQRKMLKYLEECQSTKK